MALTAFSMNKIQLIGNLGKDAETRFTTNNVSVTSFGMATTSRIKGKDGNWINETTWHNVVAFSLSDYIKNVLKKGKKFYIEGRISKRDYTDKDGIKRYSVDVIADLIIPFESGSESSGPREDFQSNQSQVSEPDVQVDDNDDLPF
ncbi:MAG: single-stranded DNA-binding protein [Ignavibacteriaceae bacterium]|nr:single-stranded DNA-binding protein [Ignavibacteriaceae bacterium]